MNQKALINALVVLVVVLIVGVVYFAFFNRPVVSPTEPVPTFMQSPTPVVSTAPQITPSTIPTTNPNNIYLLFKNKSTIYRQNFSFLYPKNWEIKKYGTENDKFIEVIVDPKRVYSPEERRYVDMPGGMVTFLFRNNSSEKNSFVIGYETFQMIAIGKDKKILAKKFEMTYAENAAEVSLQGKHAITYYIDEDVVISYIGDKNGTYLQDFNKIIDSFQFIITDATYY